MKTKTHQQKGLAQRVLRSLRESLPSGQPMSLLLAVSGGADSMALFYLVKKWSRLLPTQLALAHVHHGETTSLPVKKYRLKTAQFVAQLAQQHQLPFYFNGDLALNLKKPQIHNPSLSLTSEEDLREWRWSWLKKWQHEWAQSTDLPCWVVTAHTADDLLETRLLRLIRGTGPQGFISMSRQEKGVLRPLLKEFKASLMSYLKNHDFNWQEDPTNTHADPFRNWLRKNWLSPLAQRQPGACQALARSLDLIQEEILRHLTPVDQLHVLFQNDALDIPTLLAKTKASQRQIVAQYFLHMGFRHYTFCHINEILKRLDTSRRTSKFKLLGRVWCISDTSIATSRE